MRESSLWSPCTAFYWKVGLADKGEVEPILSKGYAMQKYEKAWRPHIISITIFREIGLRLEQCRSISVALREEPIS